tara:strand:+ start:1452 stop:2495 length:1044 start_codon:yes stop_codon:yes gene_type:complete
MAKNLNGKQSKGFFNGGLLNFILDEQKRNQIMNQTSVDSLTTDSTMNEQFEEAMSSGDWFDTKTLDDPKTQAKNDLRPPGPGEPGYKKRISSSTKARQRAWEQHKKENKLTFDEDPEAKRKDGTIIPFKENAAKHQWSKEHYFVNARTFDWEKQRLATLDEEIEKEIRDGNTYSIYRPKPEYDKKGRIEGYKNVNEEPEWVRMSDGSLEKVPTGAHMFEGNDKDKTKAWQNRSMLFNSTWNEKSNKFIKTDEDKAKDKKREEFSKFLFIDIDDKEAWKPYTEMKKELFFKPYRDIKDEYVDKYVAAREFQMEAERVKHKPAFLFRGFYYENPKYERGWIFRENVFGW